MSKEIWKDITNYVGLYQVSSFGCVKNIKTGKVIKNSLSSTGYYRVCLSSNGKGTCFMVHKLVAIEFLNHKPCMYKEVVDHIDNNPLNNNLNNIQLTSVRVNTTKNRKSELGFTGVNSCNNSKKYRARIVINGKQVYLGSFKTPEEASFAYIKEREKQLNK